MDGREPAVLAAYQDLLKWALPIVARLPRHHRYGIGVELERTLLRGLEQLVRAQYGAATDAALTEANVALGTARREVRVLWELGLLYDKHYGEFCERMLAIGRQVGGWKKASSGKSS